MALFIVKTMKMYDIGAKNWHCLQVVQKHGFVGELLLFNVPSEKIIYY